jgi:hypothetical protein
MISQVSSNQQEVGKPGKEVELEEDQVPPRRLAQLVLCSEPALEWTQEHPPQSPFVWFGVVEKELEVEEDKVPPSSHGPICHLC